MDERPPELTSINSGRTQNVSRRHRVVELSITPHFIVFAATSGNLGMPCRLVMQDHLWDGGSYVSRCIVLVRGLRRG